MSDGQKTELIKARVTRSMKEAIQRIASAYPQGREAEAIVVRAALAEYLQRHGYLGGQSGSGTLRTAEEPPAAPPKKVMVLKTFKQPSPEPQKAVKNPAKRPRK